MISTSELNLQYVSNAYRVLKMNRPEAIAKLMKGKAHKLWRTYFLKGKLAKNCIEGTRLAEA
jgi:hypothetical protein